MISFDLPQNGDIELVIYNLAGQKVKLLVKEHKIAGTYSMNWDGRDERGHELASGVYLYQLRSSTQVETRKLLLLR